MSLCLGVVMVPDDCRADACWLSPFAGMTFIDRQVRLIRLCGVARVVICCPKRLVDEMADHFAGDETVAVRSLTQADSMNTQGAMLFMRAGEVFEAALFGSLCECDFNSDKTVQCLDIGGKQAGLWIATADAGGDVAASLAAGREVFCTARFSRAQDMLVGRVSHAGQLPVLEERLWARCRKSVDGYVSRWFNRSVSLFISRRLVRYRISPNQVTLGATVFGLAGAGLAAVGGYWPVLAGAVLLQVNSIIDGVDGELARIKVQSSLLGEWLDTLGDALVNICFVVALGAGAVAAGGDPRWLGLGLFNGAVMALFTAIYAYWLFNSKKGAILSTSWFEPKAPMRRFLSVGGQIDFWVRFGARVFRRDTMIAAILLAALFGVAKYLLVPFAIFNTSIVVAQVIRASFVVQAEPT